MSATSSAPGTVRVWDRFVRVAHWSLVTGVALAWITREGGGVWHEVFGYIVLAIVAARLAWGFVGPRYARFRQFVVSPAASLEYTGRVLRHTEPRYLGHNPLGAWMILALVVTLLAVSASGWLYTTDAFWGVEWVEEVHESFANVLLVLVAVHVGGVLFASRRHAENLVRAMISGKKRSPGPDDIA